MVEHCTHFSNPRPSELSNHDQIRLGTQYLKLGLKCNICIWFSWIKIRQLPTQHTLLTCCCCDLMTSRMNLQKNLWRCLPAMFSLSCTTWMTAVCKQCDIDRHCCRLRDSRSLAAPTQSIASNIRLLLLHSKWNFEKWVQLFIYVESVWKKVDQPTKQFVLFALLHGHCSFWVLNLKWTFNNFTIGSLYIV